MDELGMTRDQFSARLGCARRTLDKWLLPESSNDFRRIDETTWRLVSEIVLHERLKAAHGWADGKSIVAPFNIPIGDIQSWQPRASPRTTKGFPMFPNNPAVDAALEVLTEASEQLKLLYPDDLPEQVNSGVKRAFTVINENSQAILSVQAVVALYPRLRHLPLLPVHGV